MRKTRAAVTLLAVIIAGPAAAQTKTGTTIGQFMAIEPSARSAAMGNTGVALFEGIQSVYYNSAAMGALDANSVQFTHSEWFAGIDFDYAAAAVPVRNLGIFFASVTSLNSGDIAVRTVDKPLGTGERYSVTDVAVGAGFGRRITSRFSAGVQVNYATETIWHSSVNLLMVNLGTVYRLSESGINLGASISNLGTGSGFDGRDLAIQYDRDPDTNGDNSTLPAEQFTGEFPVPIVFRVGLGMPGKIGEQNRVLLLADAQHPSDNTESLSLGGEWEYRETLSLRAGYQQLFQEDSELGVTLGLGLAGSIGEARFRLDYAWAEHTRLQETHRMTFVLAF